MHPSRRGRQPRWLKVGWKSVLSLPDPPLPDSLTDLSDRQFRSLSLRILRLASLSASSGRYSSSNLFIRCTSSAEYPRNRPVSASDDPYDCPARGVQKRTRV